MNHPVAQRAIAAAGFMPGELSEPRAPTIIPGNPSASIVVPMIDHAVTIDGDLSKWIKQAAIELTPTQRRNVESGFIRDAHDASVLAYLGWTHEMFYVGGIITDDELVTRKRDDKIYEDDCLELYWDLDNDGFQFNDSPHDVQIGLAPSGPDGTPQLWAWGALKRRPREIQMATKMENDHVMFELGIPMTLLSGLKPGHPVGFSLAYHDRDLDGKEAKLHWSIDTTSNPGKIILGQLTLQPK